MIVAGVLQVFKKSLRVVACRICDDSQGLVSNTGWTFKFSFDYIHQIDLVMFA